MRSVKPLPIAPPLIANGISFTSPGSGQPCPFSIRRFTFTIVSRCVIAAAARIGRVAASLRLRGIKDAQN